MSGKRFHKNHQTGAQRLQMRNASLMKGGRS